MTEVVISTSIVTATLVTLAIWLARTWLIERLKADIKLDNDSKLEEVRSELQKANNNLSHISAAGDKAYSQVQASLLPTKIQAIEVIWSSVLAWDEMAAASMFVSVLDLDWVRKYGSDPSTKKTFEDLLKAPSHLDFLRQRKDVEKMRPFVSERGWALYSAYHSFYISRITKASILTIPLISHVEIFERANERNLIEKSAPKHILDLYDSNLLDGTNEYLRYLKEVIITELKLEMSGERDSNKAANNAAEILKAANDLAGSVSQKPENPGGKPFHTPETHNNALQADV
tara:strand:- start:85 stop:948 length:864 start_codon:yes stop_codon:yes gene_type:complete